MTRNQAGKSFGGDNAGWGGGLSLEGSSAESATLTNVTLAMNRAGKGTRGAANGEGDQVAGEATLTNTIILGPGKNCDESVQVSLGHNLDSGKTCALNGPGDLSNTDPRLEPLRAKAALPNHGGFTPTLALLPGSPAIDAGDDAVCPATDQRGVARPQGAACDIGAYEFQP